MTKTIEDLKNLRANLVERRRKEAYRIGSDHHDDGIVTVAHIQLAIEAIDAVIAEGAEEPESRYTLDNL
ncbi:hypothetical protein MWN34_08165 [Ancylobacter sp. 6x-1]|uniref:EAL domain-containing protein n=1 Tax=Ancylobacter crimeensis TaxID=2579147 RepID=A0ABT0DAB8_9HYPH|nr:hypothetical protein [Ancylobacter crimeensis]MCK0196887.1 hypothetical protein [Ancylobacter crimeensis]